MAVSTTDGTADTASNARVIDRRSLLLYGVGGLVAFRLGTGWLPGSAYRAVLTDDARRKVAGANPIGFLILEENDPIPLDLSTMDGRAPVVCMATSHQTTGSAISSFGEVQATDSFGSETDGRLLNHLAGKLGSLFGIAQYYFDELPFPITEPFGRFAIDSTGNPHYTIVGVDTDTSLGTGVIRLLAYPSFPNPVPIVQQVPVDGRGGVSITLHGALPTPGISVVQDAMRSYQWIDRDVLYELTLEGAFPSRRTDNILIASLRRAEGV